jgi:hypothetical protein
MAYLLQGQAPKQVIVQHLQRLEAQMSWLHLQH